MGIYRSRRRDMGFGNGIQCDFDILKLSIKFFDLTLNFAGSLPQNFVDASDHAILLLGLV